jgi:hypothetical protein
VYILGINAYHGDSAACLVADGKLGPPAWWPTASW